MFSFFIAHSPYVPRSFDIPPYLITLFIIHRQSGTRSNAPPPNVTVNSSDVYIPLQDEFNGPLSPKLHPKFETKQ